MRSNLPKLFQQLDDAVAEVFELMLSRPCTPAPPCAAALSGVTALVHFSGSFDGNCAIHLDLRSAGELAEQLTGEAAAPDSALPADAVGELCNMIAGSWKSRLQPNFASCQLSSPTIHAEAVAPASPATIIRTYHFPPHCLTLQLTLP